MFTASSGYERRRAAMETDGGAYMPSDDTAIAARVLWIANKSFEISKLKFNISESSNLRTSQGSFSAVSKPNFASKYSLESSLRDLHNALLCTVLVGFKEI